MGIIRREALLDFLEMILEKHEKMWKRELCERIIWY
jgi:hypothetical protein